jgi:hypothetical protein
MWEKWPSQGIKIGAYKASRSKPSKSKPETAAVRGADLQTYRELITAALLRHGGNASVGEIEDYVQEFRHVKNIGTRLAEYECSSRGSCWRKLANGRYKLKMKPSGRVAEKQAALLLDLQAPIQEQKKNIVGVDSALPKRKNEARGENKAAQEQEQSKKPRAYKPRATSKYRGVCWDRPKRRWHAQIYFGGKAYHVGYFGNELEAAKAYDQAAKVRHGMDAALNFPLAATSESHRESRRFSDQSPADKPKPQKQPRLSEAPEAADAEKVVVVVEEEEEEEEQGNTYRYKDPFNSFSLVACTYCSMSSHLSKYHADCAPMTATLRS